MVHCTAITLQLDFIRCYNLQSWININTDIMILSLHQWLSFSAPGCISLPSAGFLGGQWLASHTTEVAGQIGQLHLEPQAKLASLWSGTWIFGVPTVLLLIVWQQRPHWQMSPSITLLCFPVLPVTVPAWWDMAGHAKAYLDFMAFPTLSYSYSFFFGLVICYVDTFSIQ